MKRRPNPANGLAFTTLTDGRLENRDVYLRELLGATRDAGLVEKTFPNPQRKKSTSRSPLSPYDHRHTCAMLMLEAGDNPKVVSKRLGHSSAGNYPGHLISRASDDAAGRDGEVWGCAVWLTRRWRSATSGDAADLLHHG